MDFELMQGSDSLVKNNSDDQVQADVLAPVHRKIPNVSGKNAYSYSALSISDQDSIFPTGDHH